MKRKHFLLFVVMLALVVVVLLWQNHPSMLFLVTNLRDGQSIHTHTIKFTNEVIPYEKFKQICYRGSEPSSLADLKKYVSKLNNRNVMCLRNYHLFQSLYRVFYRYGEIAISDTFLVKLQKWFKGNQELVEMTRNQSLVYIHNMYSFESVVINIVREKRPISGSGGSVLSYVDKIVNESAATCSFCLYMNETATDDIGRMESKTKFSVITATTFKGDIYYANVIMKTHHPLHFTQEQFIDAMDVMMRWFAQVHRELPSYLYRVMYWDLLPKAGAKQIHPVWQITLGDYSYHSRWNQLHAAAVTFSEHHSGLNYWTSLLQIHTLLGLSYRYGKASLMTNLNPIKDAEIMVLAEKPCLDFFRLVYFTIRAFIDDIKLYALSMSMTFPKIGTKFDTGDELPVIFRIVSRGSADSVRSDIGAFGFYGTVNVNRDPYKLLHQVKDSVVKKINKPWAWSDTWDHNY